MGREREHDADAWEVGQLVRQLDLVLEQHAAALEPVHLHAVRDTVRDARVEAQLEPAAEWPGALVGHQRQPVVVGRRAPQLQARAVEDERQIVG
jgi:hypothetical protein